MSGHDVRLYLSSVTQGEACERGRDITTAMAEMGAERAVIEPNSDDIRKTVMARLDNDPNAKKLLVKADETVEAIVDEIVRDSDGMFAIASHLLDRKLRNLEKLSRWGDVVVGHDETEPVLFYMRATADSIGKHAGELSFRKGEFIAVTQADTERSFSQMWRGIVRGLAGEFPQARATKVESINEADAILEPDRGRDAFAEWQDVLAAIENHASQSRATAFTVLCWLAHARHPLALSDLVKALSWDVTAPLGHRLTFGWRAGGLDVEIVDEPADGDTKPTRTASILEIGKGLLDFDVEKATVSVLDSLRLSDLELAALFPGGHELIARTCLQILMRNSATSEMAPMLGNPDLASYPSRSWSHHVQFCKEDDSINELVADLLTKQTASKRTWMEDGYVPFMGIQRIVRTDDETAVVKAAKRGLDGVIKILLRRQNYDLDVASRKGDTAMSVAVAGGFVSTVKLLYRHGASVEVVKEELDSIDGSVSTESLIEIAARNNDDVMVALLIKLGPDRNMPLGNREPLSTAVSYKCIDAVRILVTHGAEVTDRTMWSAVGSGDLELAKLILERDDNTLAALRERDEAWKSHMLFGVIDCGSIPIAEYVIRVLGASVNHLDHTKKSVVHEAARRHHLEMVKFLMDNEDTDPMLPYRETEENSDYFNGETAVEAAMHLDDDAAWDVVDYLLERMPPGVPGPVILGMAAGAVERGKIDHAKRLISMVTPPLDHTRLTCEASLMGKAAAKNSAEILGILLDGSMAANIPDKHGTTPLHVAAANNSMDAVEVILTRGVDIDINVTTPCGVTPLQVAVSEGHLETIQVLTKHGADLSLRAEDGSSALVAAGCAEKLDAVLALLKCDVNVNDANLNGESILHYAVLDGEAGLVRRVLHLGGDPSISSRRGGTALHLAAHKGNVEIVKLLLDAGAQVEAGYQFSGPGYQPPEYREYRAADVPWNRSGWGYRDSRPPRWCKIEPGWTPLHCAACSGHDEIAGMLIAHGADIGATGQRGETPLHVAASAAQETSIALLVEKGADVKAKTVTGETPLHWAARAEAAVEAKRAADAFKCGCQKHKDDMYERAHPDESKADCAELLLGLGAAHTARNADGATPLMLAVAAGNGDVVLALLKVAEDGATSTSTAYAELLRDIAQRGTASAETLAVLSESFTETPESQAAWCDVLGGACLAGKFEMADLAIYKGAKLPKRAGPEGRNPLHFIVTHDELSDLVELVLTTGCGADVHARDAVGRNALHLAVMARGDGPTLTVVHHSQERARIVAALLSAGASPNARTPSGDTALHLACAAGDAKVVAVLLLGGAHPDIRNAALRTPLHAAVAGWAFPDIVALLLDIGAHPSPRDAHGATPLHLIREIRTDGALNRLLEAGADITAPARNGDLPLHRAVRRGNGTVTRRLLEVGADVSARGAKGRTALHIAGRHGHVALVEELGISPSVLNAIDTAGWTAAHHAAARGHERVLENLLSMGCEQGVDMFGSAVGAVPLESVVSADEAARLRRLVQGGKLSSLTGTQATVVVS